MSLALAEAGADVAIVSRKRPEAGSAVADIAKATGRKCNGFGCDVTSEEQVAAGEAAIKEFGHVDILVNNAGINIRNPIEKLSLAEFRQVQESNVVGPWLVCGPSPRISNLAARGG